MLKDEPRGEYESLLNGLRNDLQPVGTLEIVLVDKLSALLWRQRRLLIAEGAEIRKGTLRPRQLSSLQRAFVKLLLRTDDLTEAKEGAKSFSRIADWTEVEGLPNHVQAILNRFGMTLGCLLEKYLLPMLDATKNLVFSYKGNITYCVVPDSKLQLRALILALELYGYGQEAGGSSQWSEFSPSELSSAVH